MMKISTHTLTWSVTRAIYAVAFTNDISTHTLTWSVTCRLQLSELSQGYFNSHAHVERDQSVINPPTLETNFNSHAHVERDGGD